jgi:hypothetical protein
VHAKSGNLLKNLIHSLPVPVFDKFGHYQIFEENGVHVRTAVLQVLSLSFLIGD